MSSYSIVEYVGESNDGKCGYCKETGNYNSTGFWAHVLNVGDYQDLINRNWRRSGQYCYLPKNRNTCCPMYTIKCDALNFQLNKSHKKILKKMKKFLRDGIKDKDGNKQPEPGLIGSQEPKPSKERSDLQLEGINLSSLQPGKTPKANVKQSGDAADGQVQEKKKSVTSFGNSSNGSCKPSNPKKAKLIRLERKKEKLAVKGLSLNDVQTKKSGNVEKSLEDFLSEEPKDGKHRLEVKLVQSKEGAGKSIFNLYKKYQMQVHNDPAEKLLLRSYERFLVNSPLQTKLVSVSAAESSNINLSFALFGKYESAIHKNNDHVFDEFNDFLVTSPLKLVKDESSPPQGFGSFHYQYFLDGVLIAVGVIDILPECVSSVYFYYDPDYSFLSLGTYASLREIALVRELAKSCSTLTNYYLGFYIPTCPKMRYKANVKPSFLLCPEVFTWHLLDEKLSNEIDTVPYKRMNLEAEDSDKMTEDDLRNVLVLANRTAMKFSDFKRLVSASKKLKESNNDVMEYASVIGRSLSLKMLLYRQC